MCLSMTTRPSPLLRAACILVGLAGPASPGFADCQSKSEPRTIVKVTPYAGARAMEAQDSLERFIDILRDKARLWKSDVATLAADAPFLTNFTLQLDRADVMKGDPITAEQAEDFWVKAPKTLQVLYGTVFPSQGQYIVHSSMHLGRLESQSTPTLIQVTLPLQASEMGTANDSHSLVTYYALGLQAHQLQCPAAVTAKLLARANEKATDLLRRPTLADRERERIVQLKGSIETLLSNLK